MRAGIRNARVTAENITLTSKSDLDITKVGAVGVSLGPVAAVVNVGTASAEGQVQAIFARARERIAERIAGGDA